MNFEEFLEKDKLEPAAAAEQEASPEESEEVDMEDSIDVQKAVVESLAADKAEQDEKIQSLQKEKDSLLSEVAALKSEVAALKSEADKQKAKVASQESELAKVGDLLAANTDSPLSSKVAVLERDVDVPDRFPGETREHVLEVIAEAREKAEADGRLRRAQILEGILVANEKEGTLADRRASLEKLFAENGNIVSGPVIEELTKLGISHKNGEDYLLPSEIIKRTY